ncbi:MAG TPA: hypothetical protein VNI84_12700 [Pyrinomonadaceae bacterium]|nr:hypothetical protein [Pyrinomonadaceae bacterium]
MQKLFLIGFLLCGFLSVNAFAETIPARITDGRFFISRINGSYPGDPNFNAVIQTDKFTAASYLGGNYSPWNQICGSSAPDCRPGKTFAVPETATANSRYSTLFIGGCAGGCSGPQFAGGTFVINGVTYERAFFSGHFNFSRETFLIPRTIKRKGSMTFRKPFTMTGRLKVCSERDYERNCPADKILFDGEVAGRGNLIVTTQIKVADWSPKYSTYLQQQSIEYKFTR